MSWRLLDRGLSHPTGTDARMQLLTWFGRQQLRRHRHVDVATSARVHPEARVHPRNGAIHIGDKSLIAPGTIVQGNVHLGNDCSLQAYAILVGYGTRSSPTGQIWIGDGVRIAPHAMLIAANHRYEPGTPIHGQGVAPAPITIEEDVWIAGRVNVIAGVRIGRGSIIGAGAVVTEDIPPNSVAVGVPARIVRQR